MPCDCKHLDANAREIESRRVAQLIAYVLKASGKSDKITRELSRGAEYYGNPAKLNEWTAYLCGMIRGMSHEDREKYVYNAKDARSRDLADWWEDHEKWDRENGR